jgi:hypothetical protein
MVIGIGSATAFAKIEVQACEAKRKKNILQYRLLACTGRLHKRSQTRKISTMAPTTAPYTATPATAATKAPRRSSGKQSHSRSYPRGVGLDFRKLGALTLLSYIDHHGASSVVRTAMSDCAYHQSGFLGFRYNVSFHIIITVLTYALFVDTQASLFAPMRLLPSLQSPWQGISKGWKPTKRSVSEVSWSA